MHIQYVYLHFLIPKKGHGVLPEDVRREQNRAYHSLDKTALTMIRLVNRLIQARCGVVFVTSGTGLFNADTRRNSCLLSELPHAILQHPLHFKQVIDHFRLNTVEKPHPRYVDYLDDRAAIFQMTLKPLRGKHAFRRTAAAGIQPNPSKYTEEQCRRYQRFSNGIDICTNMASWVVIRKDENLPATEYLVALEGSPEMWSHWAHVSNMVEDFFKRQTYDRKDRKRIGRIDGKPMLAPFGVFKRGQVLREDCKMRIVNCVADLESETPDSKPFKLMQYPVEDGNEIQRVSQKRSSALQKKFQIPKAEADTIAKRELEALFGTESSNIDLDDPAHSLRKQLRFNANWTDDFHQERNKMFYDNKFFPFPFPFSYYIKKGMIVRSNFKFFRPLLKLSSS